MNAVIFWSVFTAVFAGFLTTYIIEAVCIAVKKRKLGGHITLKRYEHGMGWIIFFAVIQGLNAVVAVNSIDDNYFTASVLNGIKTVCFLLIVCCCFAVYFMRTRAYLTEGGILSNTYFYPPKSVQYSVKGLVEYTDFDVEEDTDDDTEDDADDDIYDDEYNDAVIRLYSEKSRYDVKFAVKCKDKIKAAEMLKKLYNEFDGKAAGCCGKIRILHYFIILILMALLFVGGLFGWYVSTKPVVFIGNEIVVKTDCEFVDLGLSHLFLDYYEVIPSDILDKTYHDILYKAYHSDSFENITSEDLTALKEMPNLKYLDITFTDVDDLTTVGELTQLEGLFIGGKNIDIDYSPIENLTRLKYFFGLSSVKLNDLSVFENADELVAFGLEGMEVPDGLDIICEKESLLSLDLNNCTAEDFSPIGKCIGLKNLVLSGTNVADLSFLENMTELEILKISDINAENYSVLLELPNLKMLYAYDTDVPNYIINKLAGKGVDVHR